MSEVVSQGNGTLIKTIGDEIMCTFPSADLAADTACEIQQLMAEVNEDQERALDVHIGFHYGPVIPESGDVFGDVVNVAARMVGLARAGEILTTSEAVEALSPVQRSMVRAVDRRPVKGKRGELEIFEVVWESAGITDIYARPLIIPNAPADEHLSLRLPNQDRRLDSQHRELTIGRDPTNDLVVADPCASRWHARVELRQDKFILSDRSTNGTLVDIPGGRTVLLKRQELILPDAGRIHIGEFEGNDPARIISFKLESG